MLPCRVNCEKRVGGFCVSGNIRSGRNLIDALKLSNGSWISNDSEQSRPEPFARGSSFGAKMPLEIVTKGFTMKTVPKGLLDEITQRLVAEFQPEEVLLFGSYAWGMSDKDSDVDLLVIVPQSDAKPPQRAMRAYRCLRGLRVPAEVLVKTRAEVERYRHVHASLERRILTKGKRLYGRSETPVGAKLADQSPA
jgi:predicted nucleotidyltransferase